MTRRILLGVLLALVLAGQSFATNYYVSAGSGNDSNPGTKTAPWKHIWKVCEATQPGDTAFLAGTFPPESNYYMSWTGYITLYPQHSGTAGAWITYTRWPDSARPVIQGKVNTCGNSVSGCNYHATVFNYQKDYIIYDGLETYWGYRGIWISSGRNIVVRNCVSYNSTGGINNNTGNIYIGPGAPYNVTIENNVCHDAMEATDSEPYKTGGFNTGGIYAEVEGWDKNSNPDGSDDYYYGNHAHRILVQNNTIYDQGGWGIRLKRYVDSSIVRNNIVYDCAEGISTIGGSGFCGYYYGNLIYSTSDNALNVLTTTTYYPYSGWEIYIFNNTIYGSSTAAIGVWPTQNWHTGWVFNNIFANAKKALTGMVTTYVNPATDTFYFDYNNYYNVDGWTFGSTFESLSSWQGNIIPYIHGKDLNSTVSDPGFENAATGKFAIDSLSTAKRKYKDTILTLWTGETVTFTEMGAYGAVTHPSGEITGYNCYEPEATDLATDSVVIRWTTDIPATSSVQYGKKDSGLTSVAVQSPYLVTDHAVILRDLDSSTTYQYRPISLDADSVACYVLIDTFRTLDTIPPAAVDTTTSEIGSAPASSATYGVGTSGSTESGEFHYTPSALREPDPIPAVARTATRLQ